MRLRLVEIEGTPEEISRLDIEHLLGHPLRAAALHLTEAAGEDPAGDELEAILRREAPAGRAGQLLVEFLDTVRSWGDVSVAPSWKPGHPGRVSYLRVHRHPRTRGAFVYVFPARLRLNFRLDGQAAIGRSRATVREVKEDNAYRVSLSLTDDAALAEALALAEEAYATVG